MATVGQCLRGFNLGISGQKNSPAVRHGGLRDLLLEGLRFSEGIHIALSGTFTATEAAVGVKNRVAFEICDGVSYRILAEWGAGQKLKNGGQLTRLRDHENEVVFEVNHRDNHLWVNLPDGRGKRLEL